MLLLSCNPLLSITPPPLFAPLAAVGADLDRDVIQLNRRDFCLEIRVVCPSVSGIDVHALLGKLGIGIQRFLSQEQQTLDDVMCYRYAGTKTKYKS